MIEDQFKLDFDRRSRLGMVEAIWGEHKSVKQISEILKQFQNYSELALVTRVSLDKAKELLQLFPSANYHSEAKCLTLGSPKKIDNCATKVIILTGGTSDIAVASEAEISLKMHGVQTTTLMDIGVAGLHRLIKKLDLIRNSKVVIACGGMEGALPTVVAGLVPQPVIGVPVSVGYGVSAGGRTALEGMLASCSPGLLVVNIDNGYGAAMAALRILLSFKA